MEFLLPLGAVAVAWTLLWWRADVDDAAGGFERRALRQRATRRRDRRRARPSRDPAARFGPRRRRDAAGTGLVARLEGDRTGPLDGDGWRRRRDGLRRVHGRL